jgi:hypothetical protein
MEFADKQTSVFGFWEFEQWIDTLGLSSAATEDEIIDRLNEWTLPYLLLVNHLILVFG